MRRFLYTSTNKACATALFDLPYQRIREHREFLSWGIYANPGDAFTGLVSHSGSRYIVCVGAIHRSPRESVQTLKSNWDGATVTLAPCNRRSKLLGRWYCLPSTVDSQCPQPQFEDGSVYRTRWWAYVDGRWYRLRDVVGGTVSRPRPSAQVL